MGFIRHNIRNAAGRFVSRAAARNPYLALGIAAGGTAYRAYNYYRSLPSSQNNSYNTPVHNNMGYGSMGHGPVPRHIVKLKRKYNSTRSNITKSSYRKKTVHHGQIQAAGAKIRSSRGLIIGKAKRMSFRQKVQACSNPPQKFDTKWTFQMDCDSGRVSAAEIPVLTKELLDPMFNSIFNNAITDTGASDPNMAATNSSLSMQYRVMISSYLTTLKFYNSSTNTARCRLVWYKPRSDMNQSLTFPVGSVPSMPLNVLMAASTMSALTFPLVVPIANNGTTFDFITTGANMGSNYQHAGWPLTGSNTTGSSTTNNVALLDPSLVPGSVEVKSVVSRYWRSVKEEEFLLEPGNQFNTSLRIINKLYKRGSDGNVMTAIAGTTVVGVLYVYGQMVFSNAAGDSTISTGSSQISVMREDTCTVKPDIVRAAKRINVSNPYAQLADNAQGKVNVETDDFDNTYEQES